MSAALHEIDDGNVTVKVAALIRGDGVDLVVQPRGRPSRTVQLSIKAAKAVAAALIASAEESPGLRL